MPLDYGYIQQCYADAGTVRYTSVLDMAPWTRNAIDSVKRFALTKNESGDQAVRPLTEDAKISTLILIDLFSKQRIAKPHIVLVPDGGVQFEWRSVGHLEVEVYPDGGVGYLIQNAQGNMISEDIVNPQAPMELIPVVKWFISEKENFDDLAEYAR